MHHGRDDNATEALLANSTSSNSSLDFASVFVGCFKVNHAVSDPDFKWKAGGHHYTAATCLKACTKKSHAYFALQHDGDCYCGRNDLKPLALHGAKGKCGVVCTHDDMHWCGSDEKRAVYQVARISSAYAGCYHDDEKDRSFSILKKGLSWSAASCKQACAGYSYMGLQASGKNCFCGNHFKKDSGHAKVPDNKCGAACAGEEDRKPLSRCGGRYINAVYSLHSMQLTTNSDIHVNSALEPNVINQRAQAQPNASSAAAKKAEAQPKVEAQPKAEAQPAQRVDSKRVAAHLKTLDRNNDTVLERRELNKGLAAVDPALWTGVTVTRLLHTLDKNGDSQLQYDEYAAWLSTAAHIKDLKPPAPQAAARAKPSHAAKVASKVEEASEAAPAQSETADATEASEAAPAQSQDAEGTEASEAAPAQSEDAEGTEASEAAPAQGEAAEAAEASEVAPAQEAQEAGEAAPAQKAEAEAGEDSQAAPAQETHDASEAAPAQDVGTEAEEASPAAPAAQDSSSDQDWWKDAIAETAGAGPTEASQAAPAEEASERPQRNASSSNSSNSSNISDKDWWKDAITSTEGAKQSESSEAAPVRASEAAPVKVSEAAPVKVASPTAQQNTSSSNTSGGEWWNDVVGEMVTSKVERIDANKDGLISRGELSKTLMEVDAERWTEVTIQLLFWHLDKNADSVLQPGEYTPWFSTATDIKDLKYDSADQASSLPNSTNTSLSLGGANVTNASTDIIDSNGTELVPVESIF